MTDVINQNATPLTEAQARAAATAPAAQPTEQQARAVLERYFKPEEVNVRLKAAGYTVVDNQTPAPTNNAPANEPEPAKPSTQGTLNAAGLPNSYSVAEDLSGLDALWEAPLSPELRAQVEEWAREHGYVPAQEEAPTGDAPAELIAFDKVYEAPKTGAEYDLHGAFVNVPGADITTLAKLDGDLRAGFVAAGIPKMLARGVADEMIQSAARFSATKEGPARAQFLHEQVAIVERQSQGAGAKTMAAFAAHALSKVPKPIRDEWIKSGAIDSAAAFRMWAEQGQRMFQREQFVERIVKQRSST